MFRKEFFFKYWVWALSLFILFVVILTRPEPVPEFWNGQRTTSFAEMLEEPPSFIYGSSINVWIYTDKEDIIREIAITGHADSRTCRQVSGLIYNTFLKKYEEPDDFSVAGATRLVNTMDKSKLEQIKENQMVKEFQKAEKEIIVVKLLLKSMSQNILPSETDKPAIAEYKAKEKALEINIAQFESEPVIQQYKRQVLSNTEFLRFSEEISKIAENSGLVQVHKIPYDLVEDAKSRISQCLINRNRAVISFEDLLMKYQIKDAAIWIDAFELNNSKPLEIEIPIADLAKSDFDNACRETLGEVEKMMIKDARSRVDFFEKQLKELEDQKKYYSTLLENQLDQEVELTMKISPDGFLINLPTPIRITKREYLQVRIPSLIKYIDSLIKEIENLLVEIENDKKRKNDSKIEALTYMALFDSMLRNWNLPVSRSQAGFDMWREKQRTPIWQRIIQGFKKKKIIVAGLAGENTVFSVKTKNKNLIIRPFQILDLAKSVLILDRDSKITEVESTWDNRELVRMTETSNDSKCVIWKNIDDTFLSKSEKKVKEALIEKLYSDPIKTINGLESIQGEASLSYIKYFAEILKSLETIKWKKDFLTEFKKLQDSPLSKEDVLEYLDGLHQLLETYPYAPVDFHLIYAFRTSDLVASVFNESNKNDLRFKPLVAWDVVQKCEAKDFNDFQNIKEEYLEKIRESILLVKERDQHYYYTANREKNIPKKQSAELEKFIKDFKGEFSLFELDALDYDNIKSNIITFSYAKNAAVQLWRKDRFYVMHELYPIIDQMEKAICGKDINIKPIFSNAKKRLDDFERSHTLIDTLARLEIAGQIDEGCDLILKKLKNELPERLALPGYSSLIARVYYEIGEYGNAFKVLFNSQTYISLYHPQLYWTRLEGDWIGRPAKVKALFKNGQIVVVATNSNQNRMVLKIFGLLEKEANSLCNKINKLDPGIWRPNGRVSDQILLAQVPVRDELKALHKFLADDGVRLSILKAMVYLGLPPAVDIVAPCGWDNLEDNRNTIYGKVAIGKIQSVKVPSLENLKKEVEDE